MVTFKLRQTYLSMRRDPICAPPQPIVDHPSRHVQNMDYHERQNNVVYSSSFIEETIEKDLPPNPLVAPDARRYC